MAHPADEPTLADRHYVTVIVRLTLDQGGRLLQGELTDTTDALPAPFIGASGLHQAIADWLAQRQTKDNRDS